jgi:hypothetical protein
MAAAWRVERGAREHHSHLREPVEEACDEQRPAQLGRVMRLALRLLGRQPAHQPHERHLRRHGGKRLGGAAVCEDDYSGWARLVDGAQAGGAEQPRHQRRLSCTRAR